MGSRLSGSDTPPNGSGLVLGLGSGTGLSKSKNKADDYVTKELVKCAEAKEALLREHQPDALKRVGLELEHQCGDKVSRRTRKC